MKLQTVFLREVHGRKKSYNLSFLFEKARKDDPCFVGFKIEKGMTPKQLDERFKRFLEVYRERFLT